MLVLQWLMMKILGLCLCVLLSLCFHSLSSHLDQHSHLYRYGWLFSGRCRDAISAQTLIVGLTGKEAGLSKYMRVHEQLVMNTVHTRV